ncbi:hypothetical protein EV359DRAFT_61978 [Lentinula novae-zelandiae]|nr:hypothetical protein EV359DRAFT_61978 [Lentinula novae-zelandiae]
MTTELGRISLGTQTSVGSAEYLSWVADLKSMMEGTLNNVRDMAVSSLVDGTARFVRMLNELYFAAKVNRRTVYDPDLQQFSKLSRTMTFRYRKVASSYRRVVVIAFKGEDNYFRKKASVTVIQALCNQIRAPTSSDIPISIPTLYHPSLVKYLGLSSSFDSGNLNKSDNYFSSFFHTFRSLPRDWEAWNLFFAIPEDQLLSTALLERRSLLFSPIEVEVGSISELTSSSEEEPLAQRMGFQSQDAEDIHQILRTPYVPQKTAEPFPADLRRRSKWTEQERRAAINCVKPDSLDKYAQEMNQRFNSLGQLSNQRYLKLDRNLVDGKVLQVYDDNQSLLYMLDTTMPANLREGLETAVQACLSDTTAQFRYQEPSASVKTRAFSSLHFTNQTRYLTHKLSQEYATLKEALEAVLQWIVEKVLRLHPDMFQEILATADLLPLNDTSPASPFTSIVMNINIGTLAHRDKNDGYACICVTIGNPKGGELGIGTRGSIVIHGDKTGVDYQKDGFEFLGENQAKGRRGGVLFNAFFPFLFFKLWLLLNIMEENEQDGKGETSNSLTEIEANYLLRIAEIQKTLYTSEKAVLDQKISLTKLILELHLHRINQIQFENSKAEETATKMKDILLDIRKKQNPSKKGKAGTPNSPPLMELDEGFEEDIEEEMEESGEMEEAPTEPLEINKSQETEIRYYDEGYFF